MKIGIIGAMKEEIQLILNMIEKCKSYSISGCKIYLGYFKNIKIFLLESGIGKTIAALKTTLLINFFKPNIIVNIGTAGSLSLDLKVGDIVISDEVCYHDVDMTVFGYSLGQVSGFPAKFSADKNLINQAEICIKQLNFNAKKGLIISGDTFISNIKSFTRVRKLFPQAIAVDMEATAIAQVCYQYQLPFVVIRSISDIVNGQSYLSFKKHLKSSSAKCCIMINKFITNLSLGR
ncbi:5'-methylthioadenosine/S-adenosylhomocysteine nucleosidase [Candidatus Pantoea edessiphila]|uniref:5'-methylthioadenosine/S-adenosylhomocysteine nucleosidase n=1 Tax=Candidatus Pantoea edessiphila TaxID=2044610 RepID=A0A2P5SWC8_9GAMM|nr:5'-methylthioadenosine/S-adenosylhomocysteine nucleosidase [Candidatus Pantoea edessiphila]PPI86616.1 5'-methylthioadenosine/S-adenosylhomocysteine nucleosidase [Candidatus Pantoea edessiphila]